MLLTSMTTFLRSIPYENHAWNGQMDRLSYIVEMRENMQRKSKQITKPVKITLMFLRNDRQTDIKILKRCIYVIGIFTEIFSCLSLIAAEKITFPLLC